MTRFNYLGPDRTIQAVQVVAILRESRMRAPLLGIALVLVVLGLARGVEDWRGEAAAQRWESLRSREAATASTRKRILALTTDVTRLEKIAASVRGIRRSGAERAEELASIGNVLPLHVWLTAIRDTENGWSLSGGARNVADVGSALLALERVPRVVSTTLVSAQGGDHDDRPIEYEMRLGRRQ